MYLSLKGNVVEEEEDNVNVSLLEFTGLLYLLMAQVDLVVRGRVGGGADPERVAESQGQEKQHYFLRGAIEKCDSLPN
jgi:hypothetical protein